MKISSDQVGRTAIGNLHQPASINRFPVDTGNPKTLVNLIRTTLTMQ